MLNLFEQLIKFFVYIINFSFYEILNRGSKKDAISIFKPELSINFMFVAKLHYFCNLLDVNNGRKLQNGSQNTFWF